MYKLDWIYNVLGEMQKDPNAALASVHNQIIGEIRTLQRDDDRAGFLEEYLDAMFYIYVETLDEQARWRNNPDDINGECKIFYAERMYFLKYLISVAADIKKMCHVEISRKFVERWRGYTSNRGNRLPDEQIEKIAPLATSNKSNSAERMPVELSSDEARAILKRAVDAGLCKPQQGGSYKWLKTKRLCAYFADVVTNKLGISKATSSNNDPYAYFKPFEILFQMDNLKQSKANYRRDGVLPREHEIVDKIVQG